MFLGAKDDNSAGNSDFVLKKREKTRKVENIEDEKEME